MEDVMNDADLARSVSTLSSRGPLLKNKLKALIVDDNPVNRMIMAKSLKSFGVETQEAINGKQAVDFFHAGSEFNLVLMDKEMPVMNGIEATKKLRSMGVHIKIVGVSGNSRDHEIQEFMEAGIDHYYVKPMERDQLISLLKEVDGNL